GLEGTDHLQLRIVVRATFALAFGVLDFVEEPEDPTTREEMWLHEEGGPGPEDAADFRPSSLPLKLAEGGAFSVQGPGSTRDEARPSASRACGSPHRCALPVDAHSGFTARTETASKLLQPCGRFGNIVVIVGPGRGRGRADLRIGCWASSGAAALTRTAGAR